MYLGAGGMLEQCGVEDGGPQPVVPIGPPIKGTVIAACEAVPDPRWRDAPRRTTGTWRRALDPDAPHLAYMYFDVTAQHASEARRRAFYGPL